LLLTKELFVGKRLNSFLGVSGVAGGSEVAYCEVFGRAIAA
jgi:hypothetical protein